MKPIAKPIARHSLVAAAAVFALGFTTPARSQATPQADLAKAPALYYTPIKHGFKGFQCEADFDWAQMLKQVTGKPADEKDPDLQYMRGVKLTVHDDAESGGGVTWTPPATGSPSDRAAMDKTRQGIEQMWGGFFKTVNVFWSGDMVTPGEGVIVTRTPTGYLATKQEGEQKMEQVYDSKLLLTSMHIKLTAVESNIKPTFQSTPSGLAITRIESSFQQTGQPAQTATIGLDYAPVDGFLLPAHAAFSAAGTGEFKFALHGCTVTR